MSLRLRLVLAGSLGILLAIGLAAFGLSALFATHVERRAKAELSVHIDQVLSGLGVTDGALVIVDAPADPRFDLPYSGLYWQIEADDQTLRSRSLWDASLAMPPSPKQEGQALSFRLAGPQNQKLLALARTVVLPSRLSARQVTAILAVDMAEIAAARRAFVSDLLPYLLLLSAALIAAGWIQVTVGLRPMKDLGRRVADLRADPDLRMGQDWPAEVGDLAAEVDRLLDARAADVNRAKMRAADLAHGLKTPLQALMGEADRLRQSGAAPQACGIESVVQAMRGTLDRELTRARRQSHLVPVRCDLRQVAEGVAAVVAKTPDGQRVRWAIDVAPGLCAAVDQSDLTEALGAIVENAVRHADSYVRLEAREAKNELIMTIADDGPGIPSGQRRAMLTRFTRADEAGTGLGLAIANEIVTGSGGGISLFDAAPGLAVRLTLPAFVPSTPK